MHKRYQHRFSWYAYDKRETLTLCMSGFASEKLRPYLPVAGTVVYISRTEAYHLIQHMRALPGVQHKITGR